MSLPIAIVGFAFRLPGDIGLESELWEALSEGRDLVSRVPADRWAVDELEHPKRSEPGKSVSFSAGVLSRIDEFDASFFGISQREAAWLDPQQRLLLELAWESMENAGCPPSRLAGSDCAVYVGISGLDYGTRGLDDLASSSAHTMTGNTLSVAANRLSYVFDLRGPSLAVDTACSSSLVALHHACNALRAGEASSALVGGVNLLLHPYPFVGFTKASMLSADGRCKVFDASGDGYVRAEGAAVLLIKPLDKALADGDTIHAVILATGVNADGARKTGITIPSVEGQSELMRQVLTRSGLSAHDIDFVEAHGTGTMVGDPVETAAIGRVYGAGREQPLPIGSIKANVGHLESASGMAGLVKTIVALKRGELPPAVHLKTLNPNIDFDGLKLRPVTERFALPSNPDRPWVAGLNSFGFGGANAHVLLQAYPATATPVVADSPSDAPLVLSARSQQALRDLAARYADFLDGKAETERYNIAWSAANRREWLDKRLVLHAIQGEQALDALRAFSRAEPAAGLSVEDGLAAADAQIAFVYAGNGSQWLGMGRHLLSESPRFADLMAELDAAMQAQAGFSILAELQADESSSRLDDTVVAQPLLFAIQVALTTMLDDYGVTPDAVIGHSVGEIAAAWAAGALSLEQSIRVITARSQAQGLTKGQGRMAAVSLSAEALTNVLAELSLEQDIELAGINSPQNVTVSGALEALKTLQASLKARGIVFRLLDLDYAFHSTFMDPIKDGLSAKLSGFAPGSGSSIPFVSTVTGCVLDAQALTTDYWWRNVREPVQFAAGIQTLISLGCRVFVEISPHAILQRYVSESLKAGSVQGKVLPTLKKNDDGLSRLADSAMRVHLLTRQAFCEHFFRQTGRWVALPNYPWQRERHWQPRTPEGLLSIERRRVHPLLGWRLHDADLAWENTLDPIIEPWLADHQVGGAIVFPGAAFLEMALAAAREWFETGHVIVEQFDIVSPMVFDGDHARSLRLSVNTRDGSFQISSKQRLSKDAFGVHAVGRLIEASGAALPSRLNDRVSAVRRFDQQTHYALAHKLGLDYGLAFQGLIEARVEGHLLEAEVSLPESLDLCGYVLHPAVLDVCFQSLIEYFADDIEAGYGVALLPVRTARLEVFEPGKVSTFRALFNRSSPRSAKADFELFDAEGRLLARAEACRFRAAALKQSDRQKVDQWTLVPYLNPHPHEQEQSPLTSLCEPVDVLHRAFVGLGQDRENWFKQQLPLIEALTLSFAYEAFCKLAEVDPEHWQMQLTGPYARWLTGLLASEGLLITGDTWQMVRDADLPPAEELWRVLLREVPASLPQLVLMGRVGKRLPDLLTGKLDASVFAQSLRHASAAEVLYSDDPAYVGTRLALQNALRDFASMWPSNRRLRVLEFSPGVSDLPTELARTLTEDRFEYVVAVPDEALQGRQHAEYPDQVHIRAVIFDVLTGGLDIESLASRKFDVIVLRHVLHRSVNLSNALAQIRALLAPGGVLLLAERHPDWSADFVGGLDAFWWHETAQSEAQQTAPAPVSALYGPVSWQKTLVEAGFEGVDVLTEPAADALSEGAFLLTAQGERAFVFEPEAAESANWLLVVDDSGFMLAHALAAQLELANQRAEVLELSAMLNRLQARKPGDGEQVVLMTGWERTPEQIAETLQPVVEIVQLLVDVQPGAGKLWLLTCGGTLLESGSLGLQSNPVQSAIWGFGRVLMNEHPELALTLLDIPESREADVVDRVCAELLWPDGANEILLTADARYTPMLQPAEYEPKDETGADAVERVRLDFLVPGQLRNLMWVADKVRPLQEHEVEVLTCATGLNFRDVMYLMGLLPDEAVENGFAGASLGLEFSGRVVRVGEGVTGFQPGDAVMGFGASCFASHVVTRADALAPVPEGWSFEAAATVPTVFFTVYYALKYLADLQPGERVLIHGAAGGVGIAAVQLARHLGADVFATAGSDDKRDFVSLLGADRVFDSRSLAFADDIRIATRGQGVDVVLNSLAGEAMRRSLDVLSPFGRFLELGKRDFFENTPLGLRPLRNNISYFGIDADQLLTARPSLAARLFREVMALFGDEILSPLPYRSFTADRVVDAFRCMQQARHIGKVVVSMTDPMPRASAMAVESPSRPALSSDKTWLVSGGTSGFGLATAQWLVEQGVRYLALMGRRGLDTPDIAEAVEQLTAQGVQVEVLACNVTDPTSVKTTLSGLKLTMPPLEGVVHAAAVYDDRLIAGMDAESLAIPLQTKLTGAWNLHQATLDIPLAHFILYSSITTAIGNPGQANYVAANAGLEGLASLRRAMGLPATCVAWGPIADAGYLTRNENIRESLSKRLGRSALPARLAVAQLGKVLGQAAPVVFVANFDWRVLAGVLPAARSSRFELLNRNLGKTAHHADAEDIQAIIAGKSADEVAEVVRHMIVDEIARVLCIKPERIEPGKLLHDLGMDSLMAVELALGLEQRFGIQLPVMMLNDAPTAEKVTVRIVEKLLGDSGGESPVGLGDQAAALAAQHGEAVTEDEFQDIVSQSVKLAEQGTRLTA